MQDETFEDGYKRHFSDAQNCLFFFKNHSSLGENLHDKTIKGPEVDILCKISKNAVEDEIQG